MALPVVLAVSALVLSAATTAYQVIQAKKQKKDALAAADARKGFEIVTEGAPEYAPIVYGRALVGGTRSFHRTANNFLYTPNNADRSFLTGAPGASGYEYSFTSYDAYNLLVGKKTTLPEPSGYMNKSLAGEKNDFLFYQQALCVGPINGVKDVIIDSSRYIDDPSLGSYGEIEATSSTKKHSGVKAALRLDFHYRGNEADNIMSVNFPERKSAVFKGLAYLSAIFRIDRDNPQFSGNIPPVQSLVEGRLVRWVTNGQISTTRSFEEDPNNYRYSTSSPYCLLDYLLDKQNGRGLDIEEIDLRSFENFHNLGARIVQTDVPVGGKFWKPTEGAQIATRNLPLYECNLVLDTSKPHRENIEAILATMGDARLVWSGGKYKLSGQYVASNEELILAGPPLTDDDLVLGQEIEINFPDASTRLNHATVRFHNEYEQFKEDSVSWPPKYSGSGSTGIGAKNYPPASGSWNDAKAAGRQLNLYGVWNGTGTTSTMVWNLKVGAEDAGSYELAISGDNTYSIQIVNEAGTTILNRSQNSWNENHVGRATVALAAGIYRITVTGTNGNKDARDLRGVSASLTRGSIVFWTTRSTSYDSFSSYNRTNQVYTEMLAEDNGVELEIEIFAEGITDAQHALAKAEELVRTSRSAIGYKLRHHVSERFYEPGDFVQVKSRDLDLGYSTPLYIRVDNSKIVADDQAEIEGTRFDWTQLAWSVKDDVNINAPNLYNFQIPQPYDLKYEKPDSAADSSGLLVAATVNYADIQAYVFYYHRPGIDATDSKGVPLFTELGRSLEPSFELPAIDAASAFFGVRVLGTNGKLSRMTTTDMTNAVELSHNWRRRVYIDANATVFTRMKEGHVIPAAIELSARVQGFANPVYRWLYGNTLLSVNNSAVISPFNEASRSYSLEVREANDPAVAAQVAEITLLSTNYNDAGADVTGEHTAKDTNNVGGKPSTELIDELEETRDFLRDENGQLISVQGLVDRVDGMTQGSDGETFANRKAAEAARDAAVIAKNNAEKASADALTQAINSKLTATATELTINGKFDQGDYGWSVVNGVYGSWWVGPGYRAEGKTLALNSQNYIRIDASRKYQLNTHFTLHGPPGESSRTYAGLQCFDKDKKYLGNVYIPSLAAPRFVSSTHAASGTYTGFVEGEYRYGEAFLNGTVFVMPMFIGQNNEADSPLRPNITVDLDTLYLEDVTESAAAANYATTASGHASTSERKATEAGGYANQAEAQFKLAQTEAGHASTSATEAATSSRNANTASRSSALSASTAQDSAFGAQSGNRQPGLAPALWTWDEYNTLAPTRENLRSYIDRTASDDAFTLLSDGTLKIKWPFGLHVHPIKAIAIDKTHRYKAVARFRLLEDGTQPAEHTLYITFWDKNGNLLFGNTVPFATVPGNRTVADGVVEMSRIFRPFMEIDNGAAGGQAIAFARIMFRSSGGTAVTALEQLYLEDVESTQLAGDYATASNSSADTAQVKADEAGRSASAASTSAQNANASAGSADTSARNAAGSAVTAGSEASAALTYRNLSAAYSQTRGLTPNGNFSEGPTGWISFGLTYGNWWVGPGWRVDRVAGELYSEIYQRIDGLRNYRLFGGFTIHGPVGTTRMYVGMQCFDLNKTHMGNIYIPLAYRYNNGGVYNVSGDFTGAGQPPYTQGGAFINGTVFVRPMMLCNYNDAGGTNPDVTVDVHALYLEDVTESKLAASQANIATEASASASKESASARTFSELSAQMGTGSLGRNASFAIWPNGQPFPTYWTNWASMDAGTARYADAPNSPYYFKTDSRGVSETGLMTGFDYDPGMRELVGGQWYVVSADVFLEFGEFGKAGVHVNFYNDQNQMVGPDERIEFAAEKAAGDDTPVGVGVAGKRYRYTKLIKASPTGTKIALYAMGRWSAFTQSSARDAVIRWYNVSIRPATESEIRIGKAGDVDARITETNRVVATHDNRLQAYFTKVASVPGAEAAIIMNALRADGSATSDITLVASQVRLLNQANGVVLAGGLTVRNGSVQIDGNLTATAGIFVGNTKLRVAIAPAVYNLSDNEGLNYGYDLGYIPQVNYGPCPIALNSGEVYAPYADVTSSSIIPRLRIRSAPTYTQRSFDVYYVNPSTIERIENFNAYDNGFNISFITTQTMSSHREDFYYTTAGTFQVDVYNLAPNGVWTLVFTGYRDIFSQWDRGGNKEFSTNHSFSFTGQGSVQGIRLVISNPRDGYSNTNFSIAIGAGTARWQQMNAASERSATPNGEKIQITVRP